MTREEKAEIIQQLSDRLAESTHFYLADTSAMTVEESNTLRGQLYKEGLSLQVVKNTLMRIALENQEGKYDQAKDVLNGTTAVVFTETANLPARIIREFRKSHEKPILKGAYIDEDFFVGDENLGMLADLKSREELLGEVIGLLQSPAKNVISALQSGGKNLAGILKTLADKEN